MSQQNVQVVRSLYDAIAAGDSARVLSLYDPECEMDFTRSPLVLLFKQEIYRGHQGLRDFFRERREEAWESIEDVSEEIIDAGGEQVISVVKTGGRGRVSGAPVQLTHAGLWTIRDAKIVRVAWLGSREEALEAAGGEESSDDVDIVVDQFKAVNERDFARAMDIYADDVELLVPRQAGFLAAGTFVGREAVGEWFGDWFRHFQPDYRFDIDEARNLGATVLIIATHHGRGRTSGVEVHGRTTYLYTVRDGKIACVIVAHTAESPGRAQSP